MAKTYEEGFADGLKAASERLTCGAESWEQFEREDSDDPIKRDTMADRHRYRAAVCRDYAYIILKLEAD